MQFIHPSQMTSEQRKANSAALQDRIANAMERAGGISAKRDAPVAREMARKMREAR